MTEIEKEETKNTFEIANIIKQSNISLGDTSVYAIADLLSNAGYRKQEDTVKEFAEKFLEYIKRVNYFAIVNWGKKDYKMNVSDISEVLNAVSKEYGIDLAEQFGKED